MKRWKQVRWTEAGQVTAILGWPASEHDTDPPEALFDRLRAAGRDDDAAMFLGQALPRYEVVAWATRTVHDLAPPRSAGDRERYFGVLQSNLSSKGAYTSEVRSLFAQ